MQQQPSQPGEIDLREYLSVLRRRKWSIVLVALMIVVLSSGLTLRQVPVYTSEARVLVLPTAPANSAFYFLVTINMDTESGLVSSDVVGSLVRDNLHVKNTVGGLLQQLDVSVEAGTEILDIDYTSPDPATAQKLSQGFAEAYLQFRQAQASEQIKSTIANIQRQVAQVSDHITQLQNEIDAEKDPAKKQQLINEQDADKGRLGVLQQNLADAGGSSIVQPGGQIVQPAFLPSSPSNTGPVRNGILGLFVGLALGVGLAFLRERLDDRLRGRDDLEETLGVPVLAVVPKVTQWRRRKEAHLATLREPRSPAAEAYRTLRTSLLFVSSQRPLKVVMVTSPSAGDGKTTTTVNLAVALAQAGKNVIVVSADLRKPRLHRFFEGVSNAQGLVDVINGERTVQQTLQDSEIRNLTVLACGPLSSRPAELLHSPKMAELFDDLRTRADFVLVDSAPVLAVADALAMASYVDGVLFVAEAQNTDRGAVARARSELEQVGAPVIGSVMNNFDPRKGGGYYYRYYYRYGYGYGAGYEEKNGKSKGRKASRETVD